MQTRQVPPTGSALARVATRRSPLIEAGIVRRYVLGSYSARKLGLQTTANAGGVHNLEVTANADNLQTLVRGQSRALLVTELMGQGVNAITGDYSRGAAGFWIENGEIAYPVAEITVAGNLLDMFRELVPADDIEFRSAFTAPTVAIGGLTIAGR